MMKRFIGASLFAAALLLPQSASADSPVYAEKVNFQMLEAEPSSIGFESDGLESASSIEVIASFDAVLDDQDAVVGKARMEAGSVYAQAEITINDKLLNPGGRHTWTLFYRASSGITLNRLQDTVVVADEDVFQTPVLGSLVLRKSTLSVPLFFPDGPAKGVLTAFVGNKLIGLKQVSIPRDLYAKTVKIKLSKKQKLKGKTLRLEFAGESSQRRLDASYSVKVK